MGSTFDLVPEDEAEAIKAQGAGGRSMSPLTLALLDGKMVHLKTTKRPTNSHVFKGRGLRLRSRTDGNGGLYLWAEKMTEEEA